MKLVTLLISTLLLVISISAGENPAEPAAKAKAQCCKSEGFVVSTNAVQAKAVQTIYNQVCPVAGETIENGHFTFVYNGRTFTICCEKCYKRVKANPEKYLNKINNKVALTKN